MVRWLIVHRVDEDILTGENDQEMNEMFDQIVGGQRRGKLRRRAHHRRKPCAQKRCGMCELLSHVGRRRLATANAIASENDGVEFEFDQIDHGGILPARWNRNEPCVCRGEGGCEVLPQMTYR